MSGFNFTSPSTQVSHRSFSGGLNSTSGPLNLQDNESPDLQNVDFDKFGSVLQRNGYLNLNTTAIAVDTDIDGLHWFESANAGAYASQLLSCCGTKLFKMDSLDGTFDDVTGTITITAGSHFDFENFLNECYITNGVNPPFKYNGGTSSGVGVATAIGLSAAKFVKQFNNYLFYANVIVSGVAHTSRIYWSEIADTSEATGWSALNFIDISKNDGQDITGFRVLGDRLVVFKKRAIFCVFFTGDNDVPFIVQRTNSPVGCVAPFSIQEAENGLVFMSGDGFYYFDGSNSTKISDKINNTFSALNSTRLSQSVSLIQRNKNKYWCCVPNGASTTNDTVLVYDWINTSWSVYDNIDACSMTTVHVSGIDERPYFGDYSGFVYRADYGDDDYPLGTQTAIDSYYKTNWKHYDDIVTQKGQPHVYLYYQINNSVLTLSYTYDLQNGDQYSQTIDMSTSSDTWDTGLWDVATWASEGGAYKRRDLTGRGRLVSFKFSNNTIGETWQIDGLGTAPHLETNV